MTYQELIYSIESTHVSLHKRTLTFANQQLVIRNWLIGFYIVEFEQNGHDHAQYGQSLLENISKSLQNKGLKGFARRSLNEYRLFYLAYPQIWQPLAAKLQLTDSELLNPKLAPQNLLSHFSFRHFTALMRIKDPLKRAFYEKEAIKGNWNARFLERQIESLLLERIGLSTDKDALIANLKAEIETIEDTTLIFSNLRASKSWQPIPEMIWKQRKNGFYSIEWTNADGANADILTTHHRFSINQGANLLSFAFHAPDANGGGAGFQMAKQIRQNLIDSGDWDKPVQTPQRNGLYTYSLEKIYNEGGYEQSIRGEFQSIVNANGGVLPNVRCTG